MLFGHSSLCHPTPTTPHPGMVLDEAQAPKTLKIVTYTPKNMGTEVPGQQNCMDQLCNQCTLCEPCLCDSVWEASEKSKEDPEI